MAASANKCRKQENNGEIGIKGEKTGSSGKAGSHRRAGRTGRAESSGNTTT